jgi:hypothetical protein
MASRREKRYMRRRKILLFAPYPTTLYATLLSQCQRSNRFQVHPFTKQNIVDCSRAHIFVRHDIDTNTCIQKMHLLLDIDQDLGIPAGVYFRADDREYRLSDYRNVIQALRSRRLEIGLHTLCYLEDDYLSALGRETGKFYDELGFKPRSFTVHGLGPQRLEARLRFYEEVAPRLGEFGYEFCDCHSLWRRYNYVIEDCHRDEGKEALCIYDDFSEPPSFLGLGENLLILTHPCYWKG